MGGLTGGPNADKTRKIKQVAIKSQDLLEILKDFGLPEDATIKAMSPLMLVVSSEDFEEVPFGEKLPIFEIKVESMAEITLKDLVEKLDENK
jgi:hypothetical protein